MKSRIAAAVVAAVLASAPAGWTAEGSFKPAPNATHVIDLDTRNGAYSEWQVSDLAGVDAVRADIVVPLLGQDSRWAPGYALEVGSEAEAARVQIFSMDRKTLELVIYHRTGNGEWEAPADAKIAVDEPVAVAFDWTSAGVVTVTVRFLGRPPIKKELRLGAAPTLVRASSSTGELKIDPLRLGTSRP